MIENSAPEKLTKPFCDIGLKNTIPKDVGAAPQDATYTYGFPLVTMTPISQGGLPPKGKDFNGILYEISSHTRWANAGGVFYKFDRDFCTDIGGYPKGAVLLSNDGLSAYISTTDNNTTNFNTTPSDDWKAYAGKDLIPSTVNYEYLSLYKFNAEYATAIGGYPKGIVLKSNDELSAYVSTKNENFTDFNTTSSPDWLAWSGEAAKPAEAVHYLSLYKFNAEYAAAIGGYPKGCVLLSNDGLSAYISTIDDNITNFNEDPTTENWKAWAGEALAPATPETGKTFSNNNAFSYFMGQL